MSVQNTKGYYSIPLPVGSVIPFAGQVIPYGFLECDGALYAPTFYPDLFQVIGFKYGNGLGYFAVPDLNGTQSLVVGSNTSPLTPNPAPEITGTLTASNIPDGIPLDITTLSSTASLPTNGSGDAQAIEFNNAQQLASHTSGGDFIDYGTGVNQFNITATDADVTYTGENTPFTAPVTGQIAPTIQLIYIIKAEY